MLEVDHPSVADILHFKKYAQDGIAEQNATLSLFSADKIELIHADDPAVPRALKTRYQFVQKGLEKLQNDVSLADDILDNGKQKLGKVFAASGFRENERGMVFDWALIGILPNRSGGANIIPANVDVPEHYQYKYNPSSSIIMDTEQPQTDMQVFKLGRRTEFTDGRVKGLRETDLKSWAVRPDGTWLKKASKAIVPVSDSAGDPFGDPGDAGSFVLNEFGMLMGLYLGGDDRLGTGLFTAVDDLFADIMLITGASGVRLPP